MSIPGMLWFPPLLPEGFCCCFCCAERWIAVPPTEREAIVRIVKLRIFRVCMYPSLFLFYAPWGYIFQHQASNFVAGHCGCRERALLVEGTLPDPSQNTGRIGIYNIAGRTLVIGFVEAV